MTNLARFLIKGALYRIWCGVNRLGDSGVKVVDIDSARTAFVIPAGQLLLTRRGKTRMYTVGIVFSLPKPRQVHAGNIKIPTQQYVAHQSKCATSGKLISELWKHSLFLITCLHSSVANLLIGSKIVGNAVTGLPNQNSEKS